MPRKARREPERYRWDSVRLLGRSVPDVQEALQLDAAGRADAPEKGEAAADRPESEKCGSTEGGACRGRWAGQVRGLGVR